MIAGAGPWRPRCCLSCGEPLEEWRYPVQPGTLVPCLPCARLYEFSDDGLELVDVDLVDLAVQSMVADLVAAFWRARAASNTYERRAA